MRMRTFVMVLAVFLVLVGVVFAMRTDAGSSLHHWVASIHGR